jgi:molybdopterin-containing oxidoreductase family membrane subunit
VAYGVLCLGWRGDARHWARYDSAYLLLAGLATPLVISVHSIVSLDFAMEIVPGWHSPIFPPYFVAGAVFSGFAMVLVLVIPLRKLYGLEPFITMRHLDVMAKLLLATGLMVAYGYAAELFTAWFAGHPFERAVEAHRATTPVFWVVMACNVLVPQALWFRRVRESGVALFAIGLLVLAGMWLERYMIVVSSLARGYMSARWHPFVPTFWDWGVLAGSVGLFFFMFFLFLRLLPMIAIYELRKLVDDR